MLVPGLEALDQDSGADPPTVVRGSSGRLYETKAFGCLGVSSPPRRVAIKIVESRYFEPFVAAMITFNCIYAPAKAILSSGKTFERFDASGAADMTGPRLMFCALQCVCLAMALYKLNTMGLLPTHASDWVSGLKPPVPAERAYGGTAL